jgi:hypothetical protein
MESQNKDPHTASIRLSTPAKACQSIDWYAEGDERIVDADGIQIAVRFIGRKGRRGRIAITAPPGAVFRSLDRTPNGVTPKYAR